MALSSNEFTAPYTITQLAFGAPQTGVAPTASKFHPLFYCEKPTDILAISLFFTGVDSGQTMTVGYASTASVNATATAFGDATAVGTGADVMKALNVDIVGTGTTGVVTRVPAGYWVGVTTNATTVTNSKFSVGFVKSRCI